jgi:hypothetical protein
MKKLLLAVGVVLTSISLNAQTFLNAGFESPMTQIPGYANVYGTTGWLGFNFGPETTSPSQGSQAVKLTTTNDPALNAALGWGDDVITGVLSQRINGPVSNPADFTVSLDLKFTKMGTDTAYIQITILDTMAAGANDDLVMYGSGLSLPTSVANWTQADFTMQTVTATGTPNRIVFLAVSSTTGYFDFDTPTAGTTLWIDNVRSGSLGLLDNKATALRVYPNPATTVLNIDSKEEVASVNILTTDGKVVSTSTSTNVNVEALNAGMYIYQVTTVSGAIETGNFVKN